ncbi:MAG: hypothetical protein IIB27_03575 [Chloroflexi bacterium]|nr:hypothetical protein [Chloroflexota bacterium]
MTSARLAAGVALMVPGWIAIWTTAGYLNPIAFALLWTGAALLMWTVAGAYPGIRRHIALAAVSVPLWWYFEAVNGRTANWEYVGIDQYSDLGYAVFASISFATVVPALASATAMIGRLTRFTAGTDSTDRPVTSRAWPVLPVFMVGAGIASEAATLAFPAIFYPLVWVAPFLVMDGVVAAAGGRSIIAELFAGIWRRAAIIAGAGLLCGGLWEFWNFWAFPKWTYDIPLLDFIPVFEMPLLGYGGYIPFAWSVAQLVVLMDLAANRFRGRVNVPVTGL